MEQPASQEPVEITFHCPLPQVARWLSLVRSAKSPQVGFDDQEGGLGRMNREAARKRSQLLTMLEAEIADVLGSRASTVEPFDEI